MLFRIERANSENEDFRRLVLKLEEYLICADNEAHSECKQYNKLETIKHTVIAYMNEKAVGCGAIRQFDQNTVEIKRMFVSEDARNKGIGAKILAALEEWAKELGFDKSILETAETLPEAIGLYKRSQYIKIPNYGQYESMEKSICFSKKLY